MYSNPREKVDAVTLMGSRTREVLVNQLCRTLGEPMDCRLPGSSVHGILQQEYWSG